MTAELQAALDRYGDAYLRNHGFDEPVIWTPEPFVQLQWPGPEILDIDVELLQSMLSDGIYTHHLLAKELKANVRQVLRAIDAAPPPTGASVTPAVWKEILPPRGYKAPHLLMGLARCQGVHHDE
ncbi:hypothetical protein [Leifsonia sp. NPDC058230]|uniref:hypothetical protein n=1 Tax=Leifsonia sp. NPDC058230 TaxID=3346391 RepID=UPI0036DE0D36